VEKKLIITTGLEYDPFRDYSHSGSCKMKCPLGDCIIEVVLLHSLDKVIQVIDIKSECKEDTTNQT